MQEAVGRCQDTPTVPSRTSLLQAEADLGLLLYCQAPFRLALRIKHIWKQQPLAGAGTLFMIVLPLPNVLIAAYKSRVSDRPKSRWSSKYRWSRL